MTHESVLLEEALAWLNPGPGKVLVDGTLGLGGHARRWLEASAPDGQVVGFDRDPEALLEAGRVLQDHGSRAVTVHDDYRNAAKHLAGRRVDALLLDLGVSSLQLDKPERGFSFRADGPLDMRMDPTRGTGAATLVNEASEEELCEIFWKYGEERFARRIARRLVEARARKRLESTRDLEGVIFHAVPRQARYGRIHPATRCFQALRIAVNSELESLESFLPEGVDMLKPYGRFVVITFHSLEDRIVKNAFKAFQKAGKGKVLTAKPVLPSEPEKEKNPRSRSAKLRVFERGEWEVLR